MILHTDNLRVGGSAETVKEIHDMLFEKFQVTVGDCSRFLGMDMKRVREEDTLTMSMATYITSTVERFRNYDTSSGFPMRELTGCILWAVLCVHGTFLMRAKSLASRCNDFDEKDWKDALKVLKRLEKKKEVGIVFRKGCAGKERVPRS